MSQPTFFQKLYRAPEVDPITGKALSIPVLNPLNKYGRTFHFAWLGFFVAFLSWFAFAPLVHDSLKEDLHLTTADVANSNIAALASTLLVRVIVGPLTDRFGPRWTMAGCLLAGAVPTAFAPLITNANGLIVLRFFIGILGGTFVPCQVWTTAFFDKSVVGRANALAAGWGNAGGGVTFFVMPAVVNGFVSMGYSHHIAWRIAFPSCPLIIIVCTAAAILVFGKDTPNGKWADRAIRQENMRQMYERDGKVTDVPLANFNDYAGPTSGTATPRVMDEKNIHDPAQTSAAIEEADSSIIEAPTVQTAWQAAYSLQTMLVALPYICTFGAELAIEGVISALYQTQAKRIDGEVWSQQLAGNWAAMFGLLNVITRPLGGYIADLIYARTNVAYKKWWLMFLGVMEGIFFVWIGFCPNLPVHHLIGALVGLAIFMEAGNGANFALVPHLNPKHNGVVTGIVGSFGNLGGVIFNLVFRYEGTNYFKALYIIGFVIVAIHVLVCWIPVPGKHGRP
ncbi:hypothetical protein YB2330_002506 [Saitoella coloradoensis]